MTKILVKLTLPLVIALVLLLPAASGTRADPLPSEADAAYPLNHTFDAAGQPIGSPPPNSDFETPGYAIGSPPSNYDLEAPAVDAGTPPTNHDFETGDFTGWTTSGTTSIESDAEHGYYAKLGSSGTIISSPFTVDSTAQNFAFDIGYLSTSGYSWVKVYALSGPDYGTQTLLANLYCSSCGYWERSYADASQYLGQSIKLKFRRFMGNVGIDDVSAEITFPDFELEDTVKRMEEGGDTYARLDEGSLTSAPFTLDSEVQYVKVDIKGIDSLGRSQYKVYVLSGPGFETSTQAALGYADYGWQTVLANVSDWQGQQIKLKVAEVAYSIGTDDIGRQWVEVSEWDVTEDTRLEEGGPGGNYVSTNGKVTSSAFTLDPDVQQLSLRYSATEFTTFYVELLRGPDFSEVVDLAGYMSADETQWKSLKAGVSLYAGETVKLRVRRYFGGRLVLDDAGLPEITVPGWKLATNDAVATGEDSNGTYVTPFESDSAFFLDSVDISPGIIDRPGKVDQKYYAISYDIGYSTGNLMEVYWRNSSGEWWKLTQDAADTPTGYRTRHFYIADFMFQEGYFRVKLAGGGKVYSIADNVARQHMREPFSQKVGLSVDTSTGSFGFEDRDLTVEGRVPLVLTRYYSGHSDRFGPLGYRWTHSFDTHLEITTGDDAGVVFGSGGEEFFIWNPAYETFSPADARVHDELVKNEDDTYTLTTKENLDYNFDSDGKLTTIEDLDGNTVSLTYDGSDRLISVEDPDGRTLTFAYDGNGRLASVTDPTDAVVSYAYDANGDLTSVTDPEDGVRTYSYSKHRLTQVVDQNGKTLFTNTLDSVNRVVEQTDALGHTISISYDTPDKGVTQVVDPESNTAKYYYDAVHRTTAKVDPLGQVISYVYDSVGNLEKVIDPLFNEWEFAYDDSGNLTSSTDPLGNPIAITYNPQHLPTTITDARGNVTTLTYDDQGNLTSTTDPLDNVTTYTYDDDGNLTSMTNPLSETETYTYDAQGNRISRTDPLGHTWQWTYNAAGRMTSETDPLGNTTQYIYDLFGRITGIRNALGEETTFLYDLPGHLLMVEDPLGNRTLWAYDDRGLAVSKTDPADKITTYTYDANRNMTSVTDPLGNVTTYAYDENNRLESVTDPAGDTTSYTYDDAGRLASEEDPLGRITSYEYDDAGRLNEMTLPNDGIFTFEYDPDGNLISETDPLDHTTSYMYDEISRRTRVTDPLLNWTSYNYDDASRLIEVVNALGYTTSYGYDDAGRLTSITDPLDNVRSFGYDDAGNRTSSTDPVGRTTTFSYDELNRMASVTDPIGNTTTYTFDAAGRTTVVTRPSGNATTYAYDPRDLLTSVTDALLNVTTYAYDDAGRQISMTDPRGNVTSYGHDPTGRLTTITDALGGVVTFSYDDAGQQTEVTNPRGKTTIYTYDDLGNVLTETDPLERVQSYSYDDLGRLSQTTDARGVVVDYEYDELDRLISVTYPSGSVTYGYDDLGRRISMIDPTGTTTWGYDNASRVTSVASPQGTVDYEYNDAGQRTAMTLPGSRTVEYDYDDAGRLSALTDWQARTITSGYDPDGQRTSIARPNGIDTTYGYDDAGRLTSVIHSGSGGPIESFSYTLDENGNRVAVTSSAGTETYTLDALDRVTSVLYPNGDQVTYEYDDNGNRLTMTVNGVPTNYSYDDADQLLSDGSTTYTYDNNGNLIAAGTDTFTWDYADRLTSATVGGTCGSYSYDGDGTRVEKTVDEVDTSYLWDRQAGLPLLVDDETNAYLHADGALAELDGASQPTYLLDDALGSVRGLTDLGGSLTGTADYDVFGQVRAASGTSSAFGFTGEQFDAETGFTFLRARYLDPRLGRFLSADSIQPNAPGTQGYNLYTYVANNPTTWVDPSGQSILPAIVAAAIQSIRVFLATTPPIGWGLIVLIVAPPIICALDPDCSAEWWEYDKIIRHYGSKTWEGAKDLPVDMLLDAPNSFPPIPSPRRAAECLGDPLGCSYPLRAPFTIALEQAFRRLSDYGPHDVHDLGDGITLITNCRGLCELVQAVAFTIGHTIFTTSPGLRDEILEHEKRHVEQFEKMGDTFWGAWLLSGGASVIGCLAVLPAGGDGGDYWHCLHDTNILEILADW